MTNTPKSVILIIGFVISLIIYLALINQAETVIHEIAISNLAIWVLALAYCLGCAVGPSVKKEAAPKADTPGKESEPNKGSTGVGDGRMAAFIFIGLLAILLFVALN